MSDVFCFTYFLSGFLFRVRGRVGVRDGVGDGFRVRVRFRASVRARWGQGFIHHNPNLLELKLRPSGKTRKKQKIVIGLEILSQFRNVMEGQTDLWTDQSTQQGVVTCPQLKTRLTLC